MCWLPIDQLLLQPGDTTCNARLPSPCSVAQLLASRLRRIGDQLEKSWTDGETESGISVAERRLRSRTEERLTSFALKARMQESEEAVMNGGVQRI
ncbi:hypothetical protein F7725_018133 [Dissostichus mawsoni]|uniref:Uncharacterized protein n=1 Tax=Dissostichus mawsoni TaxID=36200 RepID=A0A7J5XQK3_DISMA|nr:hypothetical protein F7725_018133 [Dissostichus mawsoni]